MPRNNREAQPPASAAVTAEPLRFGAAPEAAREIEVAVETPINIVYGNMPYAVMMASPSDLEDFVTGFSLTEGIVRGADEIRSVAVEPKDEGVIVTVELAPGRFREHLARRRNLSGRTSCGLCGVETIEEIPMADAATRASRAVSAAAIEAALTALDKHQPLNQLTRAVHGAAWCDASGAILTVREDVGRHNALDKLIGAALRRGGSAAEGFLLITSRCSFEMVEKAAAFGARSLVAVSAPTSLALERARALDMTLLAVARRDSVTVFHGAGRVVGPVCPS